MGPTEPKGLEDAHNGGIGARPSCFNDGMGKGEADQRTAMDVFKIRVTDFNLCKSPSCSFENSSRSHLVINTHTVEFHEQNATAISYAWGSYGRQKRTIGHRANDASPVEMELGEEWEPTEFVTALNDICEENGKPCWIDQLSIPQTDDEEIKLALARIPDIYRTLPVIALLPGPMCECKRPGVSFDPDRPDVDGTNPIQCWNNLSLASYFGRLWPRQELHYARHLRARWTSSALATCTERTVSGVDTDLKRNMHRWELARRPGQLAPLTRHWALQELQSRLDATQNNGEAGQDEPPAYSVQMHGVAGVTIMIQADAAYKAAAFSLAAWEDLHAGAKATQWGSDREGVLKRFLRGETLVEDFDAARISLTDQQRLFRFLRQVSIVGSERRSTTQARDLVLAVWPDCPRYEIPATYKEMPLSQLLEDAVLQLERRWNVAFVTYKPSGLFTSTGSQDASTALLWRPTMTLHNGRSTSEVYGGISAGLAFYSVPNYSVWCLHPNEPVLAPRFENFELFCARQFSAFATFEFLQSALQKLPAIQMEKILSGGWISAQSENLQNDLLIFCVALREGMERQERDADKQQQPWRDSTLQSLSTVDFPRLVYWLICLCCGIEPAVARSHGLHLIVNCTPGPNYARLGLFRVSAEVLNASRTCIISGTGTAFLADQDTELKWAPPAIEVAFPEGSSVVGSDSTAVRSDYIVLGVWAPLRITRAGDRLHIAQGYVATLGTNALEMTEEYLTSGDFTSDLRDVMADYIARTEEARVRCPSDSLAARPDSWSTYRTEIWIPREDKEATNRPQEDARPN